MGKVIIFQASPRKKGTTAALLAEVAAGAQSAGAEVVEYNLNDPGLRGCQSCMSCRREDAVACVQKDYLNPMYADLKDASGVVLGTPIYMSTITAQAWILVDRLFPAMGPDFAPRFPGKKFGTVITQGAPDPVAYSANLAGVLGFLSSLGWENAGNVTWAGAEGEPSDNLKTQAFELGKSLA
ncbi:MAG: flavodoxin family protein [Coriobacteriales bacterium]|jgi:multimeric flavodoxin WrbA|nr:flavodoxin family protein [Coriobacteriales bacterium]